MSEYPIPEDLKHLRRTIGGLIDTGHKVSAIAGVDELIERIAHLEAQNKALEWKPITADNLPKVGDEVIGLEHITPNPFHPMVLAIDGWHMRNCKTPTDYYSHGRLTHFRAINPPAIAQAKEQE